MEGPLHQFVVAPLVPITVGSLNLSFTNSTLWMFISVAAAYFLVIAGTRHASMVPGRLQSVVEMAYEFVAGLIRDNAGKEGMRFFPAIFTLFMFILFGNMLSLVPTAFAVTSHIIVTFALALTVWVLITVLGFVLHGAHFFSLFVPKGAPKAMIPILVPIEMLSYCVRPISLSVRLFVNMMAGHTMLAVFAGFITALGVFGFAPLAVTVALFGFEIAVAFLQAYVFTVLTCIYLHDAIHMH